MPRSVGCAVGLGAVLVFLSSCGPIQSTSVISDADVQLSAAKTAGAEKYATYEWTLASMYLHKAREEVGRSAFESAVEYARKAKKFATEAKDKSVSSPLKGEPAPTIVPVPAPAEPPPTSTTP